MITQSKQDLAWKDFVSRLDDVLFFFLNVFQIAKDTIKFKYDIKIINPNNKVIITIERIDNYEN